MKTKFYLYLIAAVSTILFVSCNPDSIADEDNPYQTEQGKDKSKIQRPSGE